MKSVTVSFWANTVIAAECHYPSSSALNRFHLGIFAMERHRCHQRKLSPNGTGVQRRQPGERPVVVRCNEGLGGRSVQTGYMVYTANRVHRLHRVAWLHRRWSHALDGDETRGRAEEVRGALPQPGVVDDRALRSVQHQPADGLQVGAESGGGGLGRAGGEEPSSEELPAQDAA